MPGVGPRFRDEQQRHQVTAVVRAVWPSEPFTNPVIDDVAELMGERLLSTVGIGKPTIAAVNGFAITGGMELAINCDILVASTNARFADTHARVGIVPGWACRSSCRG